VAPPHRDNPPKTQRTDATHAPNRAPHTEQFSHVSALRARQLALAALAHAALKKSAKRRAEEPSMQKCTMRNVRAPIKIHHDTRGRPCSAPEQTEMHERTEKSTHLPVKYDRRRESEQRHADCTSNMPFENNIQ
jgi:hypothetical protein